ncbi:MAG: DUF3592 domain-containing protein [Chthoniobacter sp.]|uniref:DUF3592 domain-containing protein n=1 Tax=Chthoniobacter sp. TaxID=2510640 RepID=UPI0032ACD4E7
MSSLFSKSVTVRKPSAASTGCVRLFCGAFLLIGIGAFSLGTIYPALQVVAGLRWQETPCTVDSSRVVVHHSTSSRGSPTYNIEVVYHYRCEAGTFTSKRYQFATGSTSGKDRKQRVVDQYPPGRQTVCYVNPSNPAEAVIHRGLNVEMLFGFIALPFALVGGVGLYFSLRPAGRKKRLQKKAVPTFAPATAEPVPLKPETTPLGKFFLVLFFALFWNGFMSIFVYLTFSPSHSHSVPIFAKIFVGFFCLIGLVIALGAIGAFTALFNPRVRLSARTNAVPLGGEFQFQWNVTGRAGRLHNIRILLEGREQTVSRSGDSLQTHTQTFAEIPIFQAMADEALNQGQGRVSIPAGLMHSFNGPHNKIVWRIRVSGDVPRFPKVEEDYPINVLPRGKTT